MPAESRAFALVAADKKKEAVKAFKHLLKINPSNIKARRKLIGLLEDLERPDKEIGVQKKYLEYYRWAKKRRAERLQEQKAKGRLPDGKLNGKTNRKAAGKLSDRRQPRKRRQ